jgi:hypothetical protein
MTLSTAVLHFDGFFTARDDSSAAKICIVMPGLDPGIHPSSQKRFRGGWIAGSSPAMTEKALTVNAPPTRPIFINSKPRRALRRGGQSPLSAAAPSCGPTMGIVMGRPDDNGGGGAMQIRDRKC